LGAALVFACAIPVSSIAAVASIAVPALAQAANAPAVSLGVTIVANPDAGVTSLTRAQVAGIFSGTYTMWSDVGGAAIPIHPISRGSSTIEKSFQQVFLAGANVSPTLEHQADLASVITSLVNRAGAVSFVDASDLGSAETLRIIAVSDLRATDSSGIVNIGTVSDKTKAGSYASSVAPGQAGLDSTEAHTLITRDFIQENSSPIAEFTRIATIAPSTSTAGKSGVGTTNGPGLTEQTLTIRGMSTDFINVRFDGIPFSDTNDPSFHSTSFFPQLLIGGVDVVRGPGNASDVGYASFGGSENMYSIAPSETPSVVVNGSYGSFGTSVFGGVWKSGRQAWLGNGTLMLSYNNLTANGYLSYNFVKQVNYGLKYEVPIGKKTLLDVFGTSNSIFLNQSDAGFPDGATAYEQGLYGPNYSLNSMPGTANNFGYNFEQKSTDFGYIRLRTQIGPAHIDNKTYTYRYDNETTSADAIGTVAPKGASTGLPSSGTLTCNAGLSAAQCAGAIASGTNADFTFNASDIAGYLKRNKYFVVGDIFDSKFYVGSGFISAGVWLEHSSTDRHNYNIDLNNGGWNYAAGNGCDDNGNLITNFYTNASGVLTPQTTACKKNGLINGYHGNTGLNAGLINGSIPVAAVNFDQQSAIYNAQPYLEAEYTLGSGTTLYPGIRYLDITRYDDAQIEAKIRVPANEKLNYHTALPFFSLNQRITKSLAFYAQYGEGYEIPDIATFYIANPNLNSTVPNESFTYQAGFVGKTNLVAWDADYYTVNFTNLVTALKTDVNGAVNCGTSTGETGLPCNYSNYFNIGGAKYYGFEAEGTVALGAGFALYANWSTDTAIPSGSSFQNTNVPVMTAAGGLLFKSQGFDFSAIYKQTGRQYLNSPPQNNDPAFVTDLAAYLNPINQIAAYGTLDLSATYRIDKYSTVQANGYNITNVTPLLTNGSTGTPFDKTLLISQAPASFLITYTRKLF
jgi:iron complex outermembrane receptor protein